MTSPTDRLGLKRPEGTDPFIRADFVYNLDVQEDFPGVHPCSSTSRPTWGLKQRGLLIHEMDTGALLRWTGTAFRAVSVYDKQRVVQASPNVEIATNGSYSQNLGDVTVNPSARVMVHGYVYASGYPSYLANIFVDDSTNITMTPSVLSRYTNGEAANPVMGSGVVTAGSHTLSLKIERNPAGGNSGALTISRIVVFVSYAEVPS